MISKGLIVKTVIEFIRKETGYTKEATFGVGFDEFTVKSQEELNEGRIKIIFKYFFEEDGFSQYPKNHELEGFFILDKIGKIQDWVLEEVYTGPATTLGPYKQQENKEI